VTFFLGLLKLIPWWVWPMLALASWGLYENQRADGLQADLELVQAEQRAQAATAAEVSHLLKLAAARSKEKDDVEKARIARRYAELQRLHVAGRPERQAAAAAPACQGGTGAGLSGPDAGFLVGEATRANGIRRALVACYDRVDILEDALSKRP
jgi:hypothetical protein